MPPRICTSCEEPHITTDWYPVMRHDRPEHGAVECSLAHEARVRRETRDLVYPLPHRRVVEFTE